MKINKGINVPVSSLVELEVSRHVLILQQPGPQLGLVPVPGLQAAAASTECFDQFRTVECEYHSFVFYNLCVSEMPLRLQYFNNVLMYISYGLNLKFRQFKRQLRGFERKRQRKARIPGDEVFIGNKSWSLMPANALLCVT